MIFVCTTCKRDVDTPGLFCPFCGTPAPTPTKEPEDPFVGRKVAGKYFVHQKLGKGGMGLVYKATDIVLDRPVALKMLDRTLLSDAGMVQRFHREARAASRLHHSNCIIVLDFGQLEDGQLYIAMEFLPGRPLTRLLTEEFPIDHGRVVRIVAQILAALADAHAAGIIHRDLKLSNVMVEARRDEPDFVKVLDFGIAKLMAGGGSDLTTAGMICGTPGYMSPEQARGEELDARSDLYSVGIILYELLTGRLPFESETPMGLAVKHMTDIPALPSTRRPDLAISPELDAIIMKALAKDRDQRFASAEEMRAALLQTTAALPPSRTTPRPAAPTSTMVMTAAAPVSPAPVRRMSFQRQATQEGAAPADGEVGEGGEGGEAPNAAVSAAAPATARQAPRRAGPRPGGNRTNRTYIIAGIAAAVAVIVALAVTILADPFSSKKQEPIVPGPTLNWPGKADPTKADQAKPEDAKLDQAKLDQAKAEQARAEQAKLEQAKAEQARAEQAKLEQAKAEQAKAEQAKLEQAKASKKAKPESTRPDSTKPAAGTPAVGIVEVAQTVGKLAVPPASSGMGLLELNANPWGEVSVDGHPIGETPLEVKIGAGRHKVWVTHPTLGSKGGPVQVKAGQRNRFHADFDSH